MKFTASKSDIVKRLNLVQSAIPNKTSRKILKSILITATENGMVSFRATNEELDIIAYLNCEVSKPGQICVDDLVPEIINTLDGEIELEYNKKFTIKQLKRKHSPSFLLPDDFPEIVEISDYQELENKTEFIDSLSKIAFSLASSSTSTARPVLSSCLINSELGLVMSGDGDRISQVNVPLIGNVANPNGHYLNSVLSAFKEIDKLEVSFGKFNGFRGYYQTEEGYQLAWEIIISSMADKYPDAAVKLIRELSEASPSVTIKVQKEALRSVLSVAKVYSQRALSESKSAHVTLIKKNDSIHLEMAIKDLFEMYEPLEVIESEGEENFVIRFNPVQMLEAINNIVTENVVDISLFGELKPILLKGEDYFYVQSPMKLPAKQKEKDDNDNASERRSN